MTYMPGYALHVRNTTQTKTKTKGWKPPKMGGCMGKRYDSEASEARFRLSSPRYSHFLVSTASTTNCAQSGPKWAPLAPKRAKIGLSDGLSGSEQACYYYGERGVVVLLVLRTALPMTSGPGFIMPAEIVYLRRLFSLSSEGLVSGGRESLLL